MPAAWRARIEDSRPAPGPFTRTSRLRTPWSLAWFPATWAAVWAAKGVPFLEPLNPWTPAEDHVRTFPFGSLMVTRYELVDRVLRSAAFRTPRGYRDANDPAGPPRYSPDGPLSIHRRHWILFQSGEAHARVRKLVTKAFTARAVRLLTPRVEAIVDALLAPAVSRGSLEVIEISPIPCRSR